MPSPLDNVHLHAIQRGRASRPLEYIAWWQFLGFLLLLGLIWSSVALDLGHVFFGRPEGEMTWFHACLLSAGVIIVGFVTIGNTYMQQRRVLKGFITVCSYCHKVELENEAWQQMEMFVSDRTLAEFTHGVCPSCYQKLASEMEKPSVATRS